MATDEDTKKMGGGVGTKNMSPGERKARFGNQKSQKKIPASGEGERRLHPHDRKRNDDRMGPTKLIKDPRQKLNPLSKNEEKLLGSNFPEYKKFPKTNNNDGSPNKKFEKEKGDKVQPPSQINKKTPTGTVNPSQSKDTRTLKEKILETRVANALKRKKDKIKKTGEKVLGALGLEIKKKNRGGLMKKPKLAKRGF